MKKTIMILGLFLALAFTLMATVVPSKADTNVQKTFGDIARDVYVNIDSEYKEKAITAFNIFEKRQNQKYVTVFQGSKEDCEKFATFFNTCYAYTVDTMVTFGKYPDGHYEVYFKDTFNANERMSKYQESVAKAKELAKTLKGNNDTETMDNIVNYIQTNAVYDYEKAKETNAVEHNKTYYGFYEGNKIVCRGFAIAVCQLCRLNGIKCEVISSTYNKTGVRHAFNKVYHDGKETYVDATWKRKSDTFFSDFTRVDY